MNGRPNFRRTALKSAVLTWLLGGALAGCGGQEPAEGSGEPHGVVASALTYPNGSSRTVTSRRVVYKDSSGSYRAAVGLESFRAAGAPDSDLYTIRIAEHGLQPRLGLVQAELGQVEAQGDWQPVHGALLF